MRSFAVNGKRSKMMDRREMAKYFAQVLLMYNITTLEKFAIKQFSFIRFKVLQNLGDQDKTYINLWRKINKTTQKKHLVCLVSHFYEES